MDVDPKILSLVAIVLSLASAILAARTAWTNSLSPAKLTGAMPQVCIWALSSHVGEQPTGVVAERYMTPSLWLANVGAREAIISDMRLRFTAGEAAFFAYPIGSVPIEAVETPGLFNEYNRLGRGGPFSGFCLVRSGVWKSSYAFAMAEPHWSKLVNEVAVDVQVRFGGEAKWKTVLTDRIAFGSQPYHVDPLRMGGLVAGASMHHVYANSWSERRVAS